MAKSRGTRAEAQAKKNQSLLLFTINLHNFIFSLSARGSEEKKYDRSWSKENTCSDDEIGRCIK